MKRLYLALLIWVIGALCAFAQTPVAICNNTNGSNCIPGGASQTHVISAASTNSTLIAGAPSILFDVVGINTNAATAYLKFYNKATAPTCNTDTVLQTYPLVQNIPVVIPSIIGKAFSLGMGLCITGGIADNDNTNATTGIAVSLSYK